MEIYAQFAVNINLKFIVSVSKRKECMFRKNGDAFVLISQNGSVGKMIAIKRSSKNLSMAPITVCVVDYVY